jgi:hypothetical protein
MPLRVDHWRRRRSVTDIRAETLTEIKDPVKEAANIVSAPKDGVVDSVMSVVSFFAKHIVIFIAGIFFFSFVAGLISNIFPCRNDLVGFAIAIYFFFFCVAIGII